MTTRDLLQDLAPVERTRPGNLLRGPLYGLPRLGLWDWLLGWIRAALEAKP